MTAPRTGNRGPAAAAENRRALLAAARRLFAERGYQVPLNAIAREAGVGQGVLYRHFPTRRDLAFAVFADNLDHLERLAADPAPDTLARVWAALMDMTVASAAFVEVAVQSERDGRPWEGQHRLPALLAGPLHRAQEAGLIDATVTLEDLAMVQRMVYGVIATEAGADTGAAVARALTFLAPGLLPTATAADSEPPG